MKHVVAFVHRLPVEEEAQWIAGFREAMQEVEVRPLADLTEAERARAEVAIVADPDPAALGRMPRLRWIQSLWAGVERLVRETPADLAIVRMVDPQLSATMGEAVLAWTLYLHRDMPQYARQQKARIWRQHASPRAEDRTVGVLGLGEMGQAAAQRLGANGFQVVGWSRSPNALSGIPTFSGVDGLNEVLGRSDILALLLPLTRETRNLIDADVLGRMKPGASLINFARAAIVDEAALIARLDSRALNHAVLDVFATEPLPADSTLWSHEHVTALPHISAQTNVTTASAIVAKNLRAFFQHGRIPAIVDRARGY